MKNVLFAFCQKLAKKILRKIKGQKLIVKDRKVYLPDGGEIMQGSLDLLKHRAEEQIKNFQRLQAGQYKTNMRTEISLAARTQARDYVLESMLQSGEYTFDHMYVIRNPYGESPLTALALFVTEKKCKVRVTVKGKTPETDYVSVISAEKKHRIPILGLYADRKNEVLIELLDADDTISASHVVPVQTPRLPAYMKSCISVKKRASDPAFPFILINGGVDIHTCAFDADGEIRFYLKRKSRGYGIFPLSKGHFFYMEKDVATPSFSNPQTVQSHDMDYFGRVFRTYHTKNGVHHTVEEKENGNFLAGSNTMLGHTEDRVVEIDRATGEIVWQLDVEDLFDDTYIDRTDWAHVNSAAYYEKDDSVLISLRNIHSVICVDYQKKELRWLLSDPDFWKNTSMTAYLLKPEGEIRWTYQQHAAYVVDEGLEEIAGVKHIMIYDNHWAKRRKAASFDKDPLSYVSFYDVNEEEKTVRLYKRFAGPKARIRANGIYVPDKKRVYNMAGCFAEPEDGDQGAVFEYEFASGETVSHYGVKTGFFRGYSFEPHIEELAKPMKYSRDYFAGELKHPKKISQDVYQKIMEQKIHPVNSTVVDYWLQEDILMVRAKDHCLKKIYLFGEQGNYETDYSDTCQTMPIFSKMVYAHTAHLEDIPEGYYNLYIVMNDQLQDTGKYIKKRSLLA